MRNGRVLWLVRHGETTYSAGRRVAGWSDPPLTETGREQALALRGVLDGMVFAGAWSSDLQRAVETARLAWGEPRSDARLRECHFGSLEGCTYEEADGAYGEVFRRFREFVAPGGETHAAFRRRVMDFVKELIPGNHLLFVHGGVIRVLSQDLGVDRFLATGAVLRLDWDRSRAKIVHEP